MGQLQAVLPQQALLRTQRQASGCNLVRLRYLQLLMVRCTSMKVLCADALKFSSGTPLYKSGVL